MGSAEKRLSENTKRRREQSEAAIRRIGEALLEALRPGFASGHLEPVVIRLPYLDTKLVPLPRSRRTYHRAHLESLVEAHWDALGDEPDVDHAVAAETIADKADAAGCPGKSRFLANTCAACGGYCCAAHVPGNYLNRDVLREFRRRHPDASADDFVAQYMGFVPSETFRDQCVYQGEHGCGLPCDMRPRICRDHKCEGLTAVDKLVSSLQEGSSLVALRVADTITSAAIISVDGYRDVEPPEPSCPQNHHLRE